MRGEVAIACISGTKATELPNLHAVIAKRPAPRHLFRKWIEGCECEQLIAIPEFVDFVECQASSAEAVG